MAGQTNVTPIEHMRKLLDAHLTAAWMRTVGTSTEPREWWIPGEFIQVMDGQVDVEVYPYWALVEDGEIVGWSGTLSPGPNRQEAWQWRLGSGWNDCTPEEVKSLEFELGACMDDWHSDFIVLGNHQDRPPIPENVVQAMVLFENTEGA